jgi:hypothetical protein
MVALLAGFSLYGQIGTQYPGQYPPGQYPPGQYPGGGGMGIPFPGRSKKTTSKKPAIHLTGKVKQQDPDKNTLTLDADDGRTIDFKISSDTKITGESGKLNAADLHNGDELSIDAHTDDKGFFYADTIERDKAADVNSTAGSTPGDKDPDRPVLHRADSSEHTAPTNASAADSTTATATNKTDGKPTVRKDDDVETGEEHPILPAGGANPAASNDPDRPVLRRGAPAPRTSSDDSAKATAASLPPSKNDEPEIHSDPDAKPTVHYVTGTGDDFIQKAREAAFEFDEKLPNFVCQQMVTRCASETRTPNWHAQDVLSYDLVYEDGQEQYKNPKINGKAVKAGADKDSGSWSTGEFGTLLKDIFHPSTAADFRPKGQDTIAHRTAKVYTFAVDKDHSHWRIQGGTQWIMPGYKGTIWIDKETFRALRIEMEAVNIPSAFILDHTESAADYDFVLIKDQKVLLPTHAEVLSCERGSYNCSRNAIDFRNYHAYTGESSITFGNQ